MNRRRRVGVAIALLSLAAPVLAGGPDAVDDVYVETPTTCHIENWLVAPVSGNALGHVGIGCTPKRAPNLELDAAVEWQRGNAGGSLSFQPGVKYTLFIFPGAFAIGVSGTAFVIGRGRYDGFALNVPFSIVRGKYTIINLDVGYVITRDRLLPTQHQISWGGQVTQAVAPHVSLVGEVFGLDARKPGEQGGVRWSPGSEKVDIELRASHGGACPGTAVTLGLTLRV